MTDVITLNGGTGARDEATERSLALLALRREVRRYRGWMVGGYLVFLAVGLVLAAVAWEVPTSSALECGGVFLGLQALFVLGGWNVRTRTPTDSKGRIYLVIVAWTVACFASAWVGAFLVQELTNKASLLWPTVICLLLGWGVWLWIAVARKWPAIAPQTKLLSSIFFFSWVEFVTTLFVYWTRSRVRPTNCACDIPSLFSLVIVVPLVVWCVGPALIILWLVEDRPTREGTLDLARRLKEGRRTNGDQP